MKDLCLFSSAQNMSEMDHHCPPKSDLALEKDFVERNLTKVVENVDEVI